MRPDGYHEIESVLQAVTLGDDLELRPAERLVVRNALVPPDVDLVRRAAELFARRTGQRAAVSIEVAKRIPIGAGLGGGSSDAAAVLRGLCDLFAPGLPPEELCALGAEIGSDVPFFLGASPIALARGRGELLTALPPRPESFALIAWPNAPLATARVYAKSDPGPGGGARLVVSGQTTAWNDLAPAARRLAPDLDRLIRSAGERGAELRITGSGSATFALYDGLKDARAALDAVRPLATGAVLCRTLAQWPWQGNPRAFNE